MTRFRAWIIAVTLLAAASVIASVSHAQPGNKLKADVIGFAAALKKAEKEGKKAGVDAKKVLGKSELAEVMDLFRLRNLGGIGVGPVAQANPTKDGIEVEVRSLARIVPPAALQRSADLEDMGYHAAAIAELAIVKGFTQYTAKRTKKAWIEHADEMREAAHAFAKAAASKDAAKIKTAAAKLNGTCISCHVVFKD